jgi:hypothetical protein
MITVRTYANLHAAASTTLGEAMSDKPKGRQGVWSRPRPRRLSAACGRNDHSACFSKQCICECGICPGTKVRQ